MRHSPLARTLYAILAIWFALGVTTPVTLHRCPVHDGVPAAAGATVAHADMASHDMQHGSNGSSHQCHCLGDCCAAAPMAIVTPRFTLADVALIDALRPTAVPVVSFTTGPVPHALPFANGPPASLLA